MKTADLQVSDLIAGKYEGGFKLWEGSIDLCRFLIRMLEEDQQSLQVKGPRTVMIGTASLCRISLCLSLDVDMVCRELLVCWPEHVSIFRFAQFTF